ALDALLEIEIGDQELAPTLGHTLEDRIDRQQGIAREEHLSDEPLRVGVAEEREVNVRRSPSERVVLPRIGAGLHRHDAIPALVVREYRALAKKVRVERRVVVVDRMRVFPGRVGLPYLDDRPPHGPSILVEKSADEHHLLAERRAPAPGCQIGLALA